MVCFTFLLSFIHYHQNSFQSYFSNYTRNLYRCTFSDFYLYNSYHPEAHPKINCLVAEVFPTSFITFSTNVLASLETSSIVTGSVSLGFGWFMNDGIFKIDKYRGSWYKKKLRFTVITLGKIMFG